MNGTITRKQLVEQRIKMYETALATNVRKRNRTRESADRVRAKLAELKQELATL